MSKTPFIDIFIVEIRRNKQYGFLECFYTDYSDLGDVCFSFERGYQLYDTNYKLDSCESLPVSEVKEFVCFVETYHSTEYLERKLLCK